MDPYSVLGVEPAATPAEIDAAYARRRRLHDPDRQTDPDARSAARRYQADLTTAYRNLLGTDPPASAPAPGPAGATTTAVAPRGSTGSSTAGREWLTVLVALVAAYVLIQLPVALGFGVGGAVVGWFAALGAVGYALVRIRRHRA